MNQTVRMKQIRPAYKHTHARTHARMHPPTPTPTLTLTPTHTHTQIYIYTNLPLNAILRLPPSSEQR